MDEGGTGGQGGIYFPPFVHFARFLCVYIYSASRRTASWQIGHNSAHLFENYKPVSAGTTVKSDASGNHPQCPVKSGILQSKKSLRHGGAAICWPMPRAINRLRWNQIGRKFTEKYDRGLRRAQIYTRLNRCLI